MKLNRVPCAALATAMVLVFSHVTVFAEDAPEERSVPLTVKPADRAAVSSYSNLRMHALPRIGAARKTSETALTPPLTSKQTTSVPALPAPGFYPMDVTSQGGPVVTLAQIHNIYVDADAGEWGYPGNFLYNFERSNMIHVLDQYVGSTANDRYYGGKAGLLDFPIYTTLGDNDLIQMVHAVGAAFGTGYGKIYNIYIPQGVDFCDQSLGCYSPDNPSTFTFCAFHASIDFQDIGHVLFTFEPFQNVPGCQVAPGSPRGQLVDSTSSVLSHETSETISDPDPPSGWVATNSLVVLGAEIGDLCQSVDLNSGYFLNPVTNLSGTDYSIQLEYSNKYHGCANVP
jgi:hypothetical protein